MKDRKIYKIYNNNNTNIIIGVIITVHII